MTSQKTLSQFCKLIVEEIKQGGEIEDVVERLMEYLADEGLLPAAHRSKQKGAPPRNNGGRRNKLYQQSNQQASSSYKNKRPERHYAVGEFMTVLRQPEIRQLFDLFKGMVHHFSTSGTSSNGDDASSALDPVTMLLSFLTMQPVDMNARAEAIEQVMTHVVEEEVKYYEEHLQYSPPSTARDVANGHDEVWGHNLDAVLQRPPVAPQREGPAPVTQAAAPPQGDDDQAAALVGQSQSIAPPPHTGNFYGGGDNNYVAPAPAASAAPQPGGPYFSASPQRQTMTNPGRDPAGGVSAGGYQQQNSSG
ncbi:unnamed protein product, partial [Amoebophrya sp. A120]|eukprot:GSA120T00011694001.1